MTRATVPDVLGRILAICLPLICLPQAACYSPPEPDCGFSCGVGGACPEGYSCAADFICHRNGAPATLVCAVDARPDTPRPIDAPPPDADTTAPMLFASVPANGDMNVPVSSTIRVQLTEPVTGVDATSFSARDGSTPLPGAITAVDPFTYVLTPSATLPANTQIDVTLTSAIADTAGNPLATTAFSFTTAP